MSLEIATYQIEIRYWKINGFNFEVGKYFHSTVKCGFLWKRYSAIF